jgi:hypothetical protein
MRTFTEFYELNENAQLAQAVQAFKEFQKAGETDAGMLIAKLSQEFQIASEDLKFAILRDPETASQMAGVGAQGV